MNAKPPKRSRKRSAGEAGAPAKTPKVLLLTPPMVQLNTPYSAVPVLAGFLRSQGVDVAQADLSLELALRMFTRSTLCDAQKALAECPRAEDSLARTLFRLKSEVYIDGIEPVVAFLQGRADELAYRFARPGEVFLLKSLDDLFGLFLDEFECKHIDCCLSYLSFSRQCGRRPLLPTCKDRALIDMSHAGDGFYANVRPQAGDMPRPARGISCRTDRKTSPRHRLSMAGAMPTDALCRMSHGTGRMSERTGEFLHCIAADE